MNLNPHKQLLALAVPMILSNITIPLLGLVDTTVIGHLAQPYFLGATNVGAMIITFVTWLCGFLRMSTTGLAAQALGGNQQQQSRLVLWRGLLVALAIGVVFIVLQQFYFDIALKLAGGSEQVQLYAKEYLTIRICGLPAALATLVITGWLLGNHQAKTVMWLLMLINSVNLLLDVWFVQGLQLQVKGIAWATLIAEYLGVIVALFAVYRKDNHCLAIKANLAEIINFEALKRYFALNRDILLRTLCLEITFVFITFQGARLGDVVVASNAILLNFLMLISFGLDGIANACEVLVGKAVGAKDKVAEQQAVKLGLQWTSLMALGYAICFGLFGVAFIELMTSINEVQQFSQQFLPWIILLPLTACWCYLFDGVYIGLLNSKVMRNSMLFATFMVFFPTWWLQTANNNQTLWNALIAFMLARGITLASHYYLTQRKEIVT